MPGPFKTDTLTSAPRRVGFRYPIRYSFVARVGSPG